MQNPTKKQRCLVQQKPELCLQIGNDMQNDELQTFDDLSASNILLFKGKDAFFGIVIL